MSFKTHISGLYSFFVAHYRYSGGYSKSWIAAAMYRENSDDFVEKFDDLDAGDMDAIWALEYIQKHAMYHAWGETPSEAIRLVECLIAEENDFSHECKIGETKDYLRYQNERQELINNIKLISGKPPDLNSKTISELMRIYYATINDQCPQCGGHIAKLAFTSVYPNNKS